MMETRGGVGEGEGGRKEEEVNECGCFKECDEHSK